MTTTVHQLVPSVNPGDATTGHTLQLQKLLSELGHRSEIYALAVHPELEDRVRLIGELGGPSKSDAFFIYQLSAHSELGDWLIGRREQIALNYHNVTPFRFYWSYDRGIALTMKAADVQVSQLARLARLAICDSRFNEADLHARGLRKTSVSPILLDLSEFDSVPDRSTEERLARVRHAGGTRFVFVGGIAPHKAQHDLVEALAVYRRIYDPRATLSLVGRVMSPGYAKALRSMISALDLCESVEMTGSVTHEQLVAHYRGSDVFVSASEHEGFCVPLLEAMHHLLPVIAFDAGAVGDTLGQGGLLVEDKTPAAFASAMWRVASDPDTRKTLAAAGQDRVENFSLESSKASMSAVVKRWLDSGGEWTEPQPNTTGKPHGW